MKHWIKLAILALALFAFYLLVRPSEDPPRQQPKPIDTPTQSKTEPQTTSPNPKVEAGLKLGKVLDCTFGEKCWIARYSDRARGKDKADYQCGRRTQNNHKGTDFAVANFGEMKRGVAVLAAADGTVLRTRNNMQDISVLETGQQSVKNKECGNAAIIEHVSGYTTQYCHMRQGSVSVKPGDQVKAGDKIGLLGLSGDTEYPHMHLNVRKDGKRIDPFDGQRLNTSCNSGNGSESLWKEQPPYTGMDLMPLVFSSEPLTRKTRWNIQPDSLQTDAPALIVTGIGWNIMVGDTWQFNIFRPDGSQATNRRLTAKKNRQSQWYANRLFRPEGGFMPGVWKARLVVTRQNTDGTISRYERNAEVLVTD